VKKWRRALHKWDPAVGDDEEHVDLPAAAVMPPHRKAEGEQPARVSGGSEPSLKRKADDDQKDAGAAACASVPSNPCLRPTTPGSDKKQRVESIECGESQREATAGKGVEASVGIKAEACPSIFDDTNEFEEEVDYSEIPLKPTPAATASFFDLE